MQIMAGKLFKITLVVTVCLMLLCYDPADAFPGAGNTNKKTVKSSSSGKSKPTAPRHSLGSAARGGLMGAGAGGAILTALL
ncbi:uncharacterized protein LOC126561635 [Anopheles maculipalpis]|uniref:uncharacterized protein LOC126561635 n=1 Tax=Anopheles maculipalpis TaxID=1496333 RepID=UPI0021594DF3|nr:uncharacterized protein LOC126561635 [Anopheles maculipalpis]